MSAEDERQDAPRREDREPSSAGDRPRPEAGSGRKRLVRALGVVVPVVGILLVGVAALGIAETMAERADWGWRGAYYSERELEGEPTIRRDLQLRFHWFEAPPFPGGPEDAWSARWDTCLVLPEGKELEIRLGSDDGSRLSIDGEEVVDLWGDHGFEWNTENVELEAGVHHLRVDYYDKGGKAAVELKLMQPGLPEEPIPLEWLRAPETGMDAEDVCGGVSSGAGA